MTRMDILFVSIIVFACTHIKTVFSEEICSRTNHTILFCDDEKSYCCYGGTACCPFWYSDIKVMVIGFLCLCAGALVIPITCTICAYCIFNVILKERNTPQKSEDAEAQQGVEETMPDRKLPVGYHSQEKYAPEVFISPEEFILDLQSKDSDKKYLINEA